MKSKSGIDWVLLCAIAVHLTACSASEQNTTAQTSTSESTTTVMMTGGGNESSTEEAQSVALISGGSCSEGVLPAEELDSDSIDSDSTESDLNLADSDGFFDCAESLPGTAIDIPGVPSTGSGSISFTASDSTAETTPETLLDAAAVEVFPQSVFDNHSGIRLYLHNGELRIAERRFRQQNEANETIVRHKVDWGFYNGSIVLSVELASASQGNFEGGTFAFIGTQNPNDQALIGTDILINGIVFHDKNDSGVLDASDEIAQIIGGNINIAGQQPDWSITIDVQLDNLETISGYFDGDYIEIPLADASRN